MDSYCIKALKCTRTWIIRQTFSPPFFLFISLPVFCYVPRTLFYFLSFIFFFVYIDSSLWFCTLANCNFHEWHYKLLGLHLSKPKCNRNHQPVSPLLSSISSLHLFTYPFKNIYLMPVMGQALHRRWESTMYIYLKPENISHYGNFIYFYVAREWRQTVSFNASNETPGVLNGDAMKDREAFRDSKSIFAVLTHSMPSVLVLLPRLQSPTVSRCYKSI